ncbi:MAG: DUF4215 domain-containing protein, partial [Myxococcota bacterium]
SVSEGESIDTVLSIFDGTCTGSLLACSDDLGDNSLSGVGALDFVSGQTVALVIDTVGECGAFDLGIRESSCGDGDLDLLAGEQCDDGDTTSGDGCSSTCLIESGSCGDGTVDPTEECDDGGGNSDTAPDACRTNCRLPICGDLVVDTGETCDDGDTDDTDGCSTTCQSDAFVCISGDFGSLLTTRPERADTCDFVDRSAASCSPYTSDSPDLGGTWTAPGRGRFTFRATGRGSAPVLSLLDTDCLGAEAACATSDSFLLTEVTVDAELAETFVLALDTRGPCGEMDLEITGSYCGDGRFDPGNDESCDDGNLDDGDGCNTDCRRELSLCGNGTVDIGEGCDDGGLNSDLVADSCRTLCVLPGCGDFVLDTGELCDDGNLQDGDGCDSLCEVEPLWCPFADVSTSVGLGVIDVDTCESGDDFVGSCGGNGDADLGVTWTAPADGFYAFDAANSPRNVILTLLSGDCDSLEVDCTSDSSFPLTERFVSAGTTLTVVVDGDGCGRAVVDVLGRFCGDGIVDASLGEDCDDGNIDETDQCSNSCERINFCGDGALNSGEECDDAGGNSDVAPDACRETCVLAGCGDGVIDTGESCDDGLANSDTEPNACRTTCAPASCGDGVLDQGELCDDGNSDESDACRNDCTVNLGFCGDGRVGFGEECDDGPSNSDTVGGACRTDCTLPFCGDGVSDPGEGCDNGGANSDTESDACRTRCELPRCGDLVIDSGEQCDDGNTRSFDGCSRFCAVEAPPSCGNGTVDVGEVCDDGPANSDSLADACRTNCLVASCGDGVIDAGEACDDGLDNSGFISNACRLDC